jgi:hypothetical protein
MDHGILQSFYVQYGDWCMSWNYFMHNMYIVKLLLSQKNSYVLIYICTYTRHPQQHVYTQLVTKETSKLTYIFAYLYSF